jgi:hypothetical protein
MADPKPADKDQNELGDPILIKRLQYGFVIVTLLLALLDLTVEHHPHFGVDGSATFPAWYGFVTCAAMVIFSKKIWALFFKRKDDYYDD